MTPAEKVIARAQEATALCERAIAAETKEDETLYLLTATMKLNGALDALIDMKDPEAWLWNFDLWEEKQDDFRAYLERRGREKWNEQ